MKWIWLFILLASCARDGEQRSVCYIFGVNVDIYCFPDKPNK